MTLFGRPSRITRRRFLKTSAAVLAGAAMAGLMRRTAQLAAALGDPASRQRLLQNGDVVDVTDFGATGDGTTNDREAFQAAIDAAISEDLPLWIPESSQPYRIELENSHNRLEVSGDLTVLGEGRDQTLLMFSVRQSDGRDCAGFFIRNGSDVVMRDFRMEEDTHPDGYVLTGIEFEPGQTNQTVLVSRVNIAGFTHCVYSPAGGNGQTGELFLTLEKCDLSPFLQYCIAFWSVEGGHKRLHIFDCYLHDNQVSHLVYCHPHNSVLVENTRFDGATAWAFQFQGSAISGEAEYQRFIGCWFGPNNSRGLITQSRAHAPTWVEVRNCVFEGRPAVQIRSDILIDGCYFTTPLQTEKMDAFVAAYENPPWTAEILNCVFSPRANSQPQLDLRLDGITATVDNCQFYNQFSGTIIAMGGNDGNQYRIANSLFYTRTGNGAQTIALDIEDGNALVERCRFVGRAVGDRGMVVLRSSEDSPGPEARIQFNNSLFQNVVGGSVFYASVTGENSWSHKIYGRETRLLDSVTDKPVLTVEPADQPVYGAIEPIEGFEINHISAANTVVVNSNHMTFRINGQDDIQWVHWWQPDGRSDSLFTGVLNLEIQHGLAFLAGGNIDLGGSGRLDVPEQSLVRLSYNPDPGLWTVVTE